MSTCSSKKLRHWCVTTGACCCTHAVATGKEQIRCRHRENACACACVLRRSMQAEKDLKERARRLAKAHDAAGSGTAFKPVHRDADLEAGWVGGWVGGWAEVVRWKECPASMVHRSKRCDMCQTDGVVLPPCRRCQIEYRRQGRVAQYRQLVTAAGQVRRPPGLGTHARRARACSRSRRQRPVTAHHPRGVDTRQGACLAVERGGGTPKHHRQAGRAAKPRGCCIALARP